MALYRPKPIYSKSDKRLLVLIAKLLLERLDSDAAASNLASEMVALTDKEAEELVGLIEKLIKSREFQEACYFVEGVTLPESPEEGRLREIYLSARKRRGRSRAVASIQWEDFQARLGIIHQRPWYRRSLPMSYDYFLRMEKRLFIDLNLHPRVIELMMRVISNQAAEIEKIKSGERAIRHGTVRPLVADPIFRWREQRFESQDLKISTNRIVAAATIVADVSVLFTTRDWSVAGTLSMIASVLAPAAADQ